MCLALAAVTVLAGGCAAAENAVPPTARLASVGRTVAPGDGQTYPAEGTSYVVVPDGDQLDWTDLKTGAHGHFGPADGSELSSPSVSADGRWITFTQLPPLPSVQNLLANGYEPSAGYWDLDTRSGGTLRSSVGIGWTVASQPSISPDGTRVALAPTSGIYLATVGKARLPIRFQPNVAQEVTWNGNDALAYLPAPGQGNDCAVVRVTLSAAATRCLLPTTTLQSLPALNGVPWQIDDVTGSADPSLLTLDVRAASPGRSTAQARRHPRHVGPGHAIARARGHDYVNHASPRYPGDPPIFGACRSRFSGDLHGKHRTRFASQDLYGVDQRRDTPRDRSQQRFRARRDERVIRTAPSESGFRRTA